VGNCKNRDYKDINSGNSIGRAASCRLMALLVSAIVLRICNWFNKQSKTSRQRQVRYNDEMHRNSSGIYGGMASVRRGLRPN
jgi:hypothetical protein